MPSGPIAVLCEGQGSVVPGKGKDLFEKSTTFRNAFTEIQSLVETDLSDISWGPGRFRTKADPHLAHLYSLAHQYGQFRLLQESGVEVAAITGHSLGELIALVFSGAISLEEGTRFIELRGRLFARNVSESSSDMVALIGPPELVDATLASFPTDLPVYVANRNSPTQTVVSTSSATVPILSAHCLAGGVRPVPLQLGNGCHSPFVELIDAPLVDAIDGLDIRTPGIPFFSASFGRYFTEPEEIRSALRRHLLAPVEWTTAARRLVDHGHSFIELGYAKVLKGMILELDRGVDIRMFEAWQGRGVVVA